jgi:hypothetical protein
MDFALLFLSYTLPFRLSTLSAGGTLFSLQLGRRIWVRITLTGSGAGIIRDTTCTLWGTTRARVCKMAFLWVMNFFRDLRLVCFGPHGVFQRRWVFFSLPFSSDRGILQAWMLFYLFVRRAKLWNSKLGGV